MAENTPAEQRPPTPSDSQGLAALLERAGVAVAQTDAGGRFIGANPRWLELLGYSQEELLGLTVTDITHPESRMLSASSVAELERGRRQVAVEKQYVRKDGSTFWANTTMSPVLEDDGRLRGVIKVMVDDAAVRAGHRVIENQNQALQLIISGAPLEQVFNLLIAAVEQETPGEAVGSIHLYDPAKDCLRHGAAPSLPEDFNRQFDGVAVKSDVGTCVNAAARGDIVFTPDIAAAPEWTGFAHLPLGLGLVAAWSMPILSAAGNVLGIFGTYFRQKRHPTLLEIERVGMLAKTAALAIERRQAEEQLRAAVAETGRQKRLYEAVLSATPDLAYIFDRKHRFTYANRALLELWGRRWEEAVGRTCLELGYEPWLAATHDREIEEVVATRKPVRGKVPFRGTRDERVYDYIFVPVFGAGGEVEAVAGTTRDVTEAHLAAENVEFLADLVQELTRLDSEEEIIRHALRATGQRMRAHRCYFVECHERDDRIVVSADWIDGEEPTVKGSMSLSDFGGAEWWRRYSGGDFSVADVAAHPLIRADQAANYLAFAVRAYAVQPVKRAGEWTTVLAVTDKVPRVWEEKELRLLDDIAARVWPLVERARAEATLREAHDKALAASRAKDSFLAALSHELRTPLNPVLLVASEAAADPSLPPAVRADFETIVRNVSLESRLIDDLLDLSRISHGKLLLNRHGQNAEVLLRRVIDDLRPTAEEKEIVVSTELGAPDALVLADDVRLQQIFWNVLKNAIKFTPARGAVSVSTRPIPGSPARLRVEIRDSGIGLTPDELSSVFEPFVQGDHSRLPGHNPFGGLGLGLAISRKLAELHNGTLTAHSEGRERGACFSLELPIFEGAPDNRPAEQTSPSAPSIIRSVLLVEDHEPSRLALAALLRKRNIQVVPCGTAAEALSRAENQSFDLLVSDIGLPDQDGYALMNLLREKHACPGIALSGYGMETDIQRSREAGFLAHLTKPVTAEQLDQALARFAPRK